MEGEAVNNGSKDATDQVIAHLEVICQSPAFLPSKRSRQFLRYVVLETLHGRGDLIKERNIAHAVFGKGDDFEPSEYSLVRVKATEVRKRLLDYYQSDPDPEVRIELPLGGYLPRIHFRGPVITVSESSPDATGESALEHRGRIFNRRQVFWIAGGVLGVAASASMWTFLHPVSTPLHTESTPLDLLWRPVFATRLPLLIFLPVIHEQRTKLTDWVGIGPAAALSNTAKFLTERHYPYEVRFGADLTFSDLRQGPSLLLGGFHVGWTRRILRNLHFAPLTGDNSTERSFVDTQTKQVWTAVKHPSKPYVDVDYGILCRLFDSSSGQIVFLAVGTWTFGTEGAASLLFDPDQFAALVKHAPTDWETKNFEAVVRVSIIGNTPSVPQIVASYFW